MINVYDFDKTIYDGDSSIDFYFYCLKNKPSIILLLPKQFIAFVLYKLKIRDKKYFKEMFFSFVKKINNIDKYINGFWKISIRKIKPWYISQKKHTDVIISASPEFLLLPIKKKLNISKIIASKVDVKTGNFLSNNCYGEEKVVRFKSEVNKKIKSFYTDSYSDMPMMLLAQEKYLVKNKQIKKITI